MPCWAKKDMAEQVGKTQFRALAKCKEVYMTKAKVDTVEVKLER